MTHFGCQKAQGEVSVGNGGARVGKDKVQRAVWDSEARDQRRLERFWLLAMTDMSRGVKGTM